MPAIRTFQITTKNEPEPLTVSLGGSAGADPSNSETILLIIMSPSPLGGGRRWDRITDPWVLPSFPQPDYPNVTRIWFFPSGENMERNESLLQQLERQGIARRTGETITSGLMTFMCVDILVPDTEWTKCCSGCGKWEDVGEQRMRHCSACKRSTWYCNEECQKKAWKNHKRECKRTMRQRQEQRFGEGMETLFGGREVEVIVAK